MARSIPLWAGLVGLALCAALSPHMAFAAAAGLTQLQTPINSITTDVASLIANIISGIAIVAVLVLAVLAILSGRIEWGRAGMIVGAIIIAVSAQIIVPAIMTYHN